MASNHTYTFKKVLAVIVWVLLTSGTVVLLVAAISKRNNERCAGIDIKITGVQNNYFIDKKDVLDILEKGYGGTLKAVPIHSIDLAQMETDLQKSKWIKNAELFFDNNNILKVRIKEREPIARIFTTSGSSFYIDSSLVRLPLSDKFSPRLPVFTDFPTDVIVLSKEDSNLVQEIKTLSEFIGENPFWMAQVDQIDINPDRSFDLIPKLGNQVIHFGTADDYLDKFNNLLCFYKQLLTKIGWARYSAISVQFKGQVVGVRRGAEEIKADSIRSIQIMKNLIEEAQKKSNDSTNVQLQQPDDEDNINTSNINEKIPNEDTYDTTNRSSKVQHAVIPFHDPGKPSTENKNSVKNDVLKNHSKPVSTPDPDPLKPVNEKKQGIKKEQNVKQKPKAVMPPKTDY